MYLFSWHGACSTNAANYMDFGFFLKILIVNLFTISISLSYSNLPLGLLYMEDPLGNVHQCTHLLPKESG
jgi:hypothetical protein